MNIEKIRQLVSYDPITGSFTRKVDWYGQKAGEPIGTIQNNGYLCISVKGKRYLAHRIAWLLVHGQIPHEIDHINHNKLDNRILNLREVTRTENNRNLARPRNNTSGVVGVCWVEKRKKWLAFGNLENKQVFIGHFDDKESAINARAIFNKRNDFHKNHGVTSCV